LQQQRFKKQQQMEAIQAKISPDSMTPCQVKHTDEQTNKINRLMHHHKNNGRRSEFTQLVAEDEAQLIDRVAN